MSDKGQGRMRDDELITVFEGYEVVGLKCRHVGCAKVERVVLNALKKTAPPPPDIRAFGDHSFIIFRHDESSIGEADPPLIA